MRTRASGSPSAVRSSACTTATPIATWRWPTGLRFEAGISWEDVDIVRMSDTDDALTALRWCIEHDEAPTRAYRILAPLWAVVHSSSAAVITDAAERALARWGRADPRAVRVLGVAATGHFVLGQQELARERALEGIALAPSEQPALIARRALALVVYHYGRDLTESNRLFGEVVGVAEQRGATWTTIEMSTLRALVLVAGGEVEAGLALATDARIAAAKRGSGHLEAWVLHVFGAIHLAWGSEREGQQALERSLEIGRKIDYPFIIGNCLRHLGVAAALEGDRAAAASHLVGAIDHFRTTGDRVQRWEALRSAAIALGAAGDRETALRLLAGAQASLVARALAPLERRLLDRVLGDVEVAAVAPDDLETTSRVAADALARSASAQATRPQPVAAAAHPAMFRREGSMWRLAFAGSEVTMPHLKGLGDVAVLLARPGDAVHCLELAGSAVGGDLGEVVDARAREEYRARAHELQAEIEDARRANDPAREERARDELGEIAEALDAAYGLGGRVRRAGDPAERARTAVAWRIRSALGKLEPEHGQLARHLRNAVRTGTWCVYEPETPVQWQL